MAEDRFANVFTVDNLMAGVGTLTFQELNFGIQLRDRIAVVVDEIYLYIGNGVMQEFTTASDTLAMALTVSDQVTNIFANNLSDRRILYMSELQRQDFGTAAGAQFIKMPLKESFAPPLIVLPNRVFFGVDAQGLASAARVQMRMHFRTVSISQDQQLVEILEAFQLST